MEDIKLCGYVYFYPATVLSSLHKRSGGDDGDDKERSDSDGNRGKATTTKTKERQRQRRQPRINDKDDDENRRYATTTAITGLRDMKMKN